MASLNSRPVKHRRPPAYPTRLDVLASPSLLAKHVPHTWLSHRELSGALAAFLAVNTTGCCDQPQKGSPLAERGNDRMLTVAVVAPAFEQGDGRGAVGCIVVSPPVFLSEEEAFAIIQEKLSECSLQMSERAVTLPSVKILKRRLQLTEDWISGKHGWETVDVPDSSTALEVDLKDTVSGVAVEYVSKTDLNDLRDPGSVRSSVRSYRAKETAEWLAARVKQQGSGLYFGTFYDPLCKFDYRHMRDMAGDGSQPAWEEARENATAESRRLLRQQVKDFVDWLKGQGAI